MKSLNHPEASFEDFGDLHGSRVVGYASNGDISVICLTQQPRQDIVYRASTEETCSLLFKWIRGAPEFPWRDPMHYLANSIKTILETVIEPVFYESLAANPASLKILYAMLMTYLQVFDITYPVQYASFIHFLLPVLP